MKRQELSFGLLLVLIGALFLVYNLKLISLTTGLLILGLALLLGYFIERKLAYLIGGVLILGRSLIYVLNNKIFPTTSIRGFLIFGLLAILAFYIYIRQRNRVFFMGSLILSSLALFSLSRELGQGDMLWSLFLFLGLAFFIYYLVGYRKLNIVWPKHMALGFIVGAGLLYVASKTTVKITLWKFLGYVWPLLLIAIGLRIVYNIVRRNY